MMSSAYGSPAMSGNGNADDVDHDGATSHDTGFRTSSLGMVCDVMTDDQIHVIPQSFSRMTRCTES